MNLTASIVSYGDPSTGIFGYDTEVDLNIESFENKEHRETARAGLEMVFSDLWDDPARVIFSDEEEWY